MLERSEEVNIVDLEPEGRKSLRYDMFSACLLGLCTSCVRQPPTPRDSSSQLRPQKAVILLYTANKRELR